MAIDIAKRRTSYTKAPAAWRNRFHSVNIEWKAALLQAREREEGLDLSTPEDREEIYYRNQERSRELNILYGGEFYVEDYRTRNRNPKGMKRLLVENLKDALYYIITGLLPDPKSRVDRDRTLAHHGFWRKRA